MIRVLILEDEKSIARHTRLLIEQAMGSTWAEFLLKADIENAMAYLADHPIDLLILDLNLNGEDGFSVLEQTAAGAYQTIVVSAHADRALTAFDHGVLDFVAKPVDPQRLKLALERFEQGRNNAPDIRKLLFKHLGKIEMVPMEQVVFIRGAGHYAEVVLSDGRQLLHQKSLEGLANLLTDEFQRVHKSYIANMNQIAKMNIQSGGRYQIEFFGGDVVPVGRSRYKQILKTWQNN